MREIWRKVRVRAVWTTAFVARGNPRRSEQPEAAAL
ncbi:hypothetical protein QF027_002974 [Streptomyces canus]|nr:hypothetical protein [Streptomyces canus]